MEKGDPFTSHFLSSSSSSQAVITTVTTTSTTDDAAKPIDIVIVGVVAATRAEASTVGAIVDDVAEVSDVGSTTVGIREDRQVAVTVRTINREDHQVAVGALEFITVRIVGEDPIRTVAIAVNNVVSANTAAAAGDDNVDRLIDFVIGIEVDAGEYC